MGENVYQISFYMIANNYFTCKDKDKNKYCKFLEYDISCT